jgi:hypothetical protein
MSSPAIAVNRNIVPFSKGDAQDEKRAANVRDAKEQLALMPAGSVPAQLYALQAALGDMPDIECPLQHVHAPGVYARTIQLPAGSVVVGKIHKHAHINILSQGDVFVLTEGGGIERLRGPITMVSQPGTKRAVYAMTDTTWTTIHLTDKTDLAQIEDEVIAKTYEDYEAFCRTRIEGEKS